MSAAPIAAMVPERVAALHNQVIARLKQALPFDVPYGYQPLEERVGRVMRGQTAWGEAAMCPEVEMELLADDLQVMLDMPVEQLLRMVRNRSATSNCYPPGFALEQHRARMVAQNSGARPAPPVNPAALVQQFAARGVMVRAENGMLHVSPAELLSEADTAALRENKESILAALALPGAMI